MELSKRGYLALFFIVLLSWDPSSWVVVADPDTPNPEPNLEDIRSCSLIIAMDKSYQNGFNATGTLGTFNLQAYAFWSRFSLCFGAFRLARSPIVLMSLRLV